LSVENDLAARVPRQSAVPARSIPSHSTHLLCAPAAPCVEFPMKKFSFASAFVFAVVFVLASHVFVAPAFAAEPLARIIKPRALKVRVGDDFIVTVSQKIPESVTVTANIGDLKDLPIQRAADLDKFIVYVPTDMAREMKQESNFRLTLSAKDGDTTRTITDFVLVTVYPRELVEVTAINSSRKDIIPYVRPYDTFTVQGHGFFAPPDQIKFRANGVDATTQAVSPDGTTFSAVFEGENIPPPGDGSYEVTVWGHDVSKPAYGHIWIEDPERIKSDPWYATRWAFGPVGVFGAMLWLLSRGIKRARTAQGVQPGGGDGRKLNTFEVLLIDPATNTYSLSRFQFLLWLFALVYAYSFVFFARGQVAAEWAFPDMAGAQMAFLISLGTLVGSVATASVVGQKGAGEVHPSPRDLILHGGVVALDRVQQLIWTFVAIFLLFKILYSSAGTTGALPKIPDEMLTLMGASSAGYLAGKASRKQGPIITSVQADAAGLHISGMGLSIAARVRVGDTEQPRANISTEIESADKPTEFANVLLVKGVTQATVDSVPITVINPDSQEAKWTPPPAPAPKVAPAAA
jgi:hypothetical protein